MKWIVAISCLVSVAFTLFFFKLLYFRMAMENTAENNGVWITNTELEIYI